MEKLPNCVLSEIFVRLKAKQLAQMRTVSKPWNALLSHSSFVKHHLDHSPVHDNDGVLLVFKESFSFGFKKPFKLRSSQSPDLELANFIKLPVNHPQSKKRHGEVIGSVNGLICFKYESNHESEVIYIWNPSLSALLTLPPYSSPSNADDYLIKTCFRFGFDPTANDYKVVKATGVSDPLTFDPDIAGLLYRVTEWLQIEVYSMRKGTWELITQKIPSHLAYVFYEDMTCVDGHNGHLHWIASITGKLASQRILAFDLGAETVCEIPLPDSVIDDHDMVYAIWNLVGSFTGKLCVMSSFEAVGSTKFELWVMDEYGVAESWVKLYGISPCKITPLGFISHHEFLFQDSDGDLALYDSTAATKKFFNFRGGYKWLHKVVPYVDSLVWVSPSSCYSISKFQF